MVVRESSHRRSQVFRGLRLSDSPRDSERHHLSPRLQEHCPSRPEAEQHHVRRLFSRLRDQADRLRSQQADEQLRLHAQSRRHTQLHRSRDLHEGLPRQRLQQGLRHVVAGHHHLLPAHRPQFADPSQAAEGQLKIPYPRRYWSSLSPEAKSFVEGLLQIDPAARMTGWFSPVAQRVAAQAQAHPWFHRSQVPVPHRLSPSLVENLRRFQGFNVLKKAAMTAVAYHLNNVAPQVT